MGSHLFMFLLFHIKPEQYVRLSRKRFRQDHSRKPLSFHPAPPHTGDSDVWFQSLLVHGWSGRKHLFISCKPEEILLEANAVMTHSWRWHAGTVPHVTLQQAQLWELSIALMDCADLSWIKHRSMNDLSPDKHIYIHICIYTYMCVHINTYIHRFIHYTKMQARYIK